MARGFTKGLSADLYCRFLLDAGDVKNVVFPFMESETIAWIFAGCLGLVAASRFARTLFTQWRARQKAKARAAKAFRGEREAEHVLVAHGYEIIARQPRSAWAPLVNNQPYPLQLRGDLLVCRNHKRFIAEIKTGNVAPRIDHSPTRRQLLEYQLAFQVEGILLVNMETKAVSHVEFPTPLRVTPKQTSAFVYTLVGFTLGIATMWNPIRAFLFSMAHLAHLESALPH